MIDTASTPLPRMKKRSVGWASVMHTGSVTTFAPAGIESDSEPPPQGCPPAATEAPLSSQSGGAAWYQAKSSHGVNGFESGWSIQA